MKWLYLITSLITFGMAISGYETEKASILLAISSAAYICLDKVDQLKKDNNLK